MNDQRPETNGVLRYRVDELEKDVRDLRDELKTSVNRLTMAIVGFAFTIAGSAVAVLFAVAA